MTLLVATGPLLAFAAAVAARLGCRRRCFALLRLLRDRHGPRLLRARHGPHLLPAYGCRWPACLLGD
eukprot:5412188-Prymnesium_polylepis.1